MSQNLHDIEEGRVPVSELGGYASLGACLGWGIYPDKDGMVEVRSPFDGLDFSSTPEAEKMMAKMAWIALQMKDCVIDSFEGPYRQDRIRLALARRAGAALWLYRRDVRTTSSSQCAEWTFYPMSKPDGMDLDLCANGHIAIRAHALLNGTFQFIAWARIHDGQADSCFLKMGVSSGHKNLVDFACDLAEQEGEAKVRRAMAELDTLRSQLASVRRSA